MILRSPRLAVLLTERDFVAGLDRVIGLVPDLVERWPDLSRVDGRIPDRLLVRSAPAVTVAPDSPARGET